MNSQDPHDSATAASDSELASVEERGRSCDFCNDVVPSVRRVALDGDYERLRTKHHEKYACPSCFERKENVRLGLERG